MPLMFWRADAAGAALMLLPPLLCHADIIRCRCRHAQYGLRVIALRAY